MSFIGWLDHSEAEQRQVRELLQLFADKGTVDDLGIGTIRDAISNQLFPGTSIIQTRARYFLFIPWIFQRAESKHRHELVVRSELSERKLIEALRQAKDQDGLIGRQAGKDVRTLPSAIYWTGLAAYGIFLQPGLTRSQYGRAARNGPPVLDPEDELAERSPSYWHRALPHPPDGFFDFASADFHLTRDEATWLSERVLSTEPRRGPNLLGSYVRQLQSNAAVPTETFWAEPLPDDVSDDIRSLVHHAERFSCAVQGASLLYNLMLRFERADAAKDDPEQVDALTSDLKLWADGAKAVDLPAWCNDLQSFWGLIKRRTRIPLSTQTFVEGWCSLLRTQPLRDIAKNAEAQALVRSRELQHKRSQARFNNPSRLRSWNGDSGLTPLEFRWSQVRRFLLDLSTGLHGAQAGKAGADAAH
ncbi:MAG: DUF6361 family protein [Acidimicrobiia bacterium]